MAGLKQLGDGDMGPVDLGLVDIARDQAMAVGGGQFAHAMGIVLGRGPAVFEGVLPLDDADEFRGQGDTGIDRTAGADEQHAGIVIALVPAEPVGDIIDGARHSYPQERKPSSAARLDCQGRIIPCIPPGAVGR